MLYEYYTKNIEKNLGDLFKVSGGRMRIKNQVSLTRKILYGMMLLGLVFSVFGTRNLPSARAQEGEPVTPTPEVQVLVTPAPGREPRIVGGANAGIGEYPWQVRLSIYEAGNYYLCGGTLIDPQWVLTAGHCVTESGGSISAPGYVDVYVDNYDRTDSWYQHRSVIQVIRHPSYNDGTLDNDIALLRLDTPVTIGDGTNSPYTKTAAIPLVPATIGNLASVNAWVTGWGRTTEGGSSTNILQKVQLPIIENSVCNDINHYNGEITSNMMCAGFDAGGKDTCQGDSGGPLVVWNTGTGQWNLAGIISWGYGCAQPYTPGVYTRVSQYVSWIYSYTMYQLFLPLILR
jgi:secreted trypsin-like serine protease